MVQYCGQLFFRNENLSKKLIKFVTRLSCLQQPSKQQLPFINRRRLLQKILNSPFHSEFTLKLKYIVGYCFFCFTNITCCTQSEHKINCIDAQFPPTSNSFFTKYKRYSQKKSHLKIHYPHLFSPQRAHPPHAIITPAIEVHKLSKFRAVVIVSHALKYYYHGSSVQTYRKDLKSPRLLFSNIIGNNRVLRMRCKVLLFKKERGEKSGDWKYIGKTPPC